MKITLEDNNTTMFRLKEFLSTNTITIQDIDNEISLRMCRRLLSIFSVVKDCRQQKKISYKLKDLILMEYLAAIGGADSGEDVEDFWERHFKFYKRVFKYERVPSHDTFDRVMGLIPSFEINKTIVDVLLQADKALRTALKLPKPDYRHLSVDGKRLRGTGRENTMNGPIKDLQILNVYDNTTDTCLVSERIEDKTNEIPHAQAILSQMELKQTLITFDALHTQKETIDIIAKKHGDYIGGLKGNQHSLNEYAISLFDRKKLTEIEDSDDYVYHKEITHGQLEVRQFYMIHLTPKQCKKELAGWTKAQSMVCYVKTCTNNNTGKTSKETRYYLSSLKDIEEASIGIREHWGVENRLHNGLDTVMMEDQMRMANKNAALNRSIIKKMCLALYRKVQEVQNLKGKKSKRRIRKCMGWAYEEEMKQALILLDPIALRRCLTIEPKKK